MSAFKKVVLLIGDAVILYAALLLTLLFRYGPVYFKESFHNHSLPFSLIFILWLIIFYLTDLYHFQSFRRPIILLKKLLLAVLISGVVSVIVFYLFGGFFKLTPKTNLLIFGLFFLILNFGWRFLMANAFASVAVKTALLGDSRLFEEIRTHLKQNPHLGYQIVDQIKNLANFNFKELSKRILAAGVQIVVIQPHLTKNLKIIENLYQLLPFEINITNAWNFYELIFPKAPLDELDETWFIENITARRPLYDMLKRIADISMASVLFIIFLPLIVLIGLLVKITSLGPVIYRQERIGKNETPFTLYKFRSMRVNAGGSLWTEKKDSRVTFIGQFIRATHLDELPQLINIIKGDISFIGPRPESSKLVEQYRMFPYYEIRHIIKPGLTGWAQINYRPSASLEEAYEKLCYDIYYIKNRSFLLDTLILIKTVRYIFFPKI